MTIRMKKLITTLMALTFMLTLIFSTSTVAFASSAENTEKEDVAKETIEVQRVSEDFIKKQISNSSKVSSASTQISAGRSYLGNFTFTDTNLGLNRYYMGWHVRLCIAWKAADSGGDIDLNTKFFGKEYKFKCSNDGDGKDGNGYYYIEAPEQSIIYGDHSSIFYDALTREGWSAPGYLRSGNVHTWVDVR